MNSFFKNILSIIACTTLMAFTLTVQAASYEGLGVKFDYPDKYKLKAKETKTLKEIKLRKGGDLIKISIKGAFSDEIRESIAEGILNSAKSSYEISDVSTEKHTKLSLGSGALEVDALKSSYTYTIKSKNVKIAMYQQLYLFSHEDDGYIMMFIGTSKNGGAELDKVLSSLSFVK